jgi:hypothetical protein
MYYLRLTAVLLACTFLGACESMRSAELPEVPTIISVVSPEHVDCDQFGNGVVPININYTGADLVVAPPSQTVYEGQVIQFNLVGRDDVLVSTSGKEAKDGWLNGSGKRKQGKPASYHFFICVPTDLFPEGELRDTLPFNYNVDAVGFDPLDPVVVVRKRL